jgi:hypothetical protein
VIYLTDRCKENNHVPKGTLELLDWMLAIDFDVSRMPAAPIFSLLEHL